MESHLLSALMGLVLSGSFLYLLRFSPTIEYFTVSSLTTAGKPKTVTNHTRHAMWREANMKSNQFWTAVSKALAVITVTLIVALMLAPGAWAASKYEILHKFTRADGGNPEAALIFDASGESLQYDNRGRVLWKRHGFKLTPNADGSWTESMLYSFTARRDGGQPTSAADLRRQRQSIRHHEFWRERQRWHGVTS